VGALRTRVLTLAGRDGTPEAVSGACLTKAFADHVERGAQRIAFDGDDQSLVEARRLCSDKEGRSMKYKVALSETSEGVSVSVPGLPGCWSRGPTQGEALANVRDAISEYLAVRDELLRGSEVREAEVV
jgi:predicted RNase H-like HicB family nuclease